MMKTRCLWGIPLLMIAGVARGAESSPTTGPEAEAETTREALLESLLGDDPLAPSPEAEMNDAERNSKEEQTESIENAGRVASEYAQAAEQLREQLDAARERLSAGKMSEAQVAQAEAIAATKRLIELAQQASASSDTGANAEKPESSTSGAAGSQSGGAAAGASTAGTESGARQSQMAGNRNRQGKSEESSNRPAEQSDPAQMISIFRGAVIEHAWGHLPDRMRQRLRNGGSDKSLPRYETLVNRYFESLVRPDGD